MKTLLIASASGLAIAATPALAQDIPASAPQEGAAAIEFLNQRQLSTLEAMKVSQNTSATDKTRSYETSEKDGMKKKSEWRKSTEMSMAEASPYNGTPGVDTIVIVADTDPDVSVFTNLVRQAGLVDELSGEGPVTVFAPTNAAFAKLDPSELDKLKNDEDRLEQVLKAHIIPEKITVADIPGTGTEYNTLGNTVIELERDAFGDFSASDVAVSRMDIMASNGVIHVIDNVIMPEQPEGSILSTAIGS